jgi:hypothetical protein
MHMEVKEEHNSKYDAPDNDGKRRTGAKKSKQGNDDKEKGRKRTQRRLSDPTGSTWDRVVKVK